MLLLLLAAIVLCWLIHFTVEHQKKNTFFLGGIFRIDPTKHLLAVGIRSEFIKTLLLAAVFLRILSVI